MGYLAENRQASEEMMDAKRIKPLLNGSTETMLQSFYARAMYSKNPNNRFKDAKAEEIVSKLDYDFGKAAKDSAMSGGVIARTVVFDELVGDFIEKYPDCMVVNIACGLDTRFYRMDNGKLTWYNIDLPETIEVRDSVYHESGRISTIGCSAFDPAWAEKVKVRGRMLFVIEGLTMYLTGDQVKQMLGIIRDNFDNAYVMMECICPKFINKEGVEKSIQSTGAVFTWGANCFDELGSIGEGFRKVKDDNILRGMPMVNPAFKLITWLPFLKKVAQKILIFEKI
jgi:O-methyltransferase involved in polyketide biosynthesis